jgi:hypothetical protein
MSDNAHPGACAVTVPREREAAADLESKRRWWPETRATIASGHTTDGYSLIRRRGDDGSPIRWCGGGGTLIWRHDDGVSLIQRRDGGGSPVQRHDGGSSSIRRHDNIGSSIQRAATTTSAYLIC